MTMLQHFIGCRLESIRISKTSITLEFENVGGNYKHYELSISANLKSKKNSERQADGTIFEDLYRVLEDVIADISFAPATQMLEIKFKSGSVFNFNGNASESDNVAIWKDLSSDAWGVLN